VSVTKTAHVGGVCRPSIPVAVGGVCPPSIPAVSSVCPSPIPVVVGSAGLTVKCVPVPMSVFPTCVECVWMIMSVHEAAVTPFVPGIMYLLLCCDSEGTCKWLGLFATWKSNAHCLMLNFQGA
jgi:hypothetical protein